MRPRPSPSRYGVRFCDDCDGFAYVQPEPGVWRVCHRCCGSSVEHVQGDRTPGAAVKNARLDPLESSGEKQGQAQTKRDRFTLRGFR